MIGSAYLCAWMKTNGDDYRKSDAATRHKNDRFANVMIRRCDATYNHGHACSTILAQTHIFPVIFVYFIIHLQMPCLAIIRQMIDIYIYIHNQNGAKTDNPKWWIMHGWQCNAEKGFVLFIHTYSFLLSILSVPHSLALAHSHTYMKWWSRLTCHNLIHCHSLGHIIICNCTRLTVYIEWYWLMLNDRSISVHLRHAANTNSK